MQNEGKFDLDGETQELGSISNRFIAVFIDNLLVGILLLPLIILNLVDPTGLIDRLNIWLVFIFVFGYFIYMEGEYGYTYGKKVCGLQVVRSDGHEIGMKESTIRNVFRVVDVMPNFYIIGFISTMVTTKKQRIGDIAADTIVIKNQE